MTTNDCVDSGTSVHDRCGLRLAERVVHFQHFAPVLLNDLRARITIVFGRQLSVKQLDIVHRDKERRTRAGIAVMFNRTGAKCWKCTTLSATAYGSVNADRPTREG